VSGFNLLYGRFACRESPILSDFHQELSALRLASAPGQLFALERLSSQLEQIATLPEEDQVAAGDGNDSWKLNLSFFKDTQCPR
jgi:hypothetical protein